jgi:hypothetical protein
VVAAAVVAAAAVLLVLLAQPEQVILRALAARQVAAPGSARERWPVPARARRPALR